MDIPGVLAVDLVGHNGGQAGGDFGWTLTAPTRALGGPRRERSTRKQRSMWSLHWSLVSAGTWGGSSLYSDNGSAFIGDELKRSTPPSEPWRAGPFRYDSWVLQYVILQIRSLIVFSPFFDMDSGGERADTSHVVPACPMSTLRLGFTCHLDCALG